MFDELNIIVLGDVPLPIISDAIHNGYSKILDCTKQILRMQPIEVIYLNIIELLQHFVGLKDLL